MKKYIFPLFVLSFVLASKTCQSQTAWNDYISIYRKFGSPFVGGNCQMVPSCSRFADIQFRKFGFTNGFINTADRLLRCSHDIQHYNLTKINHNYKFIDFGDDSTNKANQEKWSKGVFAYSDPTDSINQFVNYLINQGHYSEALLETNRILFSTEQKFYTKELLVNYFRILRKLNLQERIQLDYEVLVPEKFKLTPEILFEIGLSWLELENLEKSSSYFSKISTNEKKRDDIVSQQTLIFQTFIESKKGKFKNAIAINEQLSENSTFLKNKKINLSILKELDNFKPKNKNTATILGIIPGGGYLYSNHPKSAISALIINSLLGFATISSFKSQNAGLGILMGFTTLGFYLGNIKGGGLAAERYNNSFSDTRIQKLYPNFSL